MIYFKIFLGLLAGVCFPYIVEYKKKYTNDDEYFKKNTKVLLRKITCDIFFAILSYLIINQTNIPTEINLISTIFIGSNGCSILENQMKNVNLGNLDESID